MRFVGYATILVGVAALVLLGLSVREALKPKASIAPEVREDRSEFQLEGSAGPAHIRCGTDEWRSAGKILATTHGNVLEFIEAETLQRITVVRGDAAMCVISEPWAKGTL